MMKRFLKLYFLIFTLTFSLFNVYAQDRSLKITTKVNANRSVDFNFEKADPGSYTVVVNFTSLNNAYNPGVHFTAEDYSGRLFSLSPTNKEQGISYGYAVSYIRGRLKPKYDANFIYLLPFKPNVKVQVAESNFLGATYFGDTTPDDWKSYRFYTTTPDSVTAIRKGTVVDIKDLYEILDEKGVSYTSKTNELIIEHADGTLATYKGFKKGSFTVKVGQTVFPGTFLGLNSRYDANGRYNISLMITYLKSADLANKPTTITKTTSFYGFVTPHFVTTDQANEVLVAQKTYTVATPPEVIAKELTKKELKLLSNPKK